MNTLLLSRKDAKAQRRGKRSRLLVTNLQIRNASCLGISDSIGSLYETEFRRQPRSQSGDWERWKMKSPLSLPFLRAFAPSRLRVLWSGVEPQPEPAYQTGGVTSRQARGEANLVSKPRRTTRSVPGPFLLAPSFETFHALVVIASPFFSREGAKARRREAHPQNLQKGTALIKFAEH